MVPLFYLNELPEGGKINEIEIGGTTFKEFVIASDIAYDKTIDKKSYFQIDEDNLIINGQGHIIDLGEYPLFLKVKSENVIIKDLHVKNANNYLSVIQNWKSLKIINCSFKNCKAHDGAAIHNEGELIVENTRFENNYASNSGGAIYNNGKMTVKNSQFIKNTSRLYGGAISNEMKLSIINCLFDENSGAEIIRSYHDCEIENCTFENSVKAIQSQGYLNVANSIFKKCDFAIYMDDGSIENCTFKNGGKILESSKRKNTIYIKDSNFIHNHCKEKGLQYLFETFYYFVMHDKTTCHIVNCNFKNNTYSKYMFNWNSQETLYLKNCIFEHNQASIFKINRGLLKLENVEFRRTRKNVISCEGDLEITNCKFQKHHMINEEKVYDIYKSERKFLKEIKS